MDAMDVSGETQIDVEHNLFKKRLDRNGEQVANAVIEKEICTLFSIVFGLFAR